MWTLALLAISVGVWWLLFRAPVPAGLGPVDAASVKMEAVDSQPAPTPQQSSSPKPHDAELSHAQISIASSDGKTVMDVQAHQAEKHGERYALKEGTITFKSGDDVQLKLTITDATYEIFPGNTPAAGTAPAGSGAPSAGAAPHSDEGAPPRAEANTNVGPTRGAGKTTSTSDDAYVTVEGSMHGELIGTGQSFDAKRLRWDEKTNVIQAEAVRYFSDRIKVDGETMRIALPAGVVDFGGPVTSTIEAEMMK